MDWVYLDNNATTRPAPEVLDAVDAANRELWANPSSVHRLGQQVRQRVELARQQVADLINAKPRELIFTSGGTESDNLALFGVAPKLQWLTLITTRIEHAAVREAADYMSDNDATVAYVDVDPNGLVQIDSLKALLEQHVKPGRTNLVSIQWANNETGVIQPIQQIAEAIHNIPGSNNPDPRLRPKVLLHFDATQVVGKLPVNVLTAGCDLLTFSAHKFHGPKGVGVLWASRRARLRPTHIGGAQERDRRGGTENVSGILGMGVAAEHADAFVQNNTEINRLKGLRDQLEQGILKALPNTVVNSGGAERLWNTTNLGFPGIEAEAVLLGLSEQGICASAGAACSSGSLDPSPVLLAMGIPEPVAHGSVRFSLSRNTTEAEIDRALEVVPRVVGRLMKVLPTG